MTSADRALPRRPRLSVPGTTTPGRAPVAREPVAREPVGRAPRGRAGERGFTLVELLVAFAILAVAMAYMTQIQTRSLQLGAKARDLRDIRVMSDTVFRKFIYELFQTNDGYNGTGDVLYAQYAEIPSAQRDQWRQFRIVFHKEKRMAAGTDPTGGVPGLESSTDGTTQGTGTSTGTGSGSTSGSGSGSSTTAADTSGEPVYVLSLEVFASDESEEPEVTLRTIVPVPAAELEESK